MNIDKNIKDIDIKNRDIEVKNISKSYDGIKVLDNISHTFQAGSVTCIMGKSGIGKTTFINILMGLEKADSGYITSNISYSVVFQENRLIEELTPITNILAVVDKSVKREVVVDSLLKIMDSESLHKKVSELSGGMKRRVAIVRAMLANSEVVVLDEPFAGLDEDTKVLTIDYIKEMLGDRTLIVVTHDEGDVNLLGGEVFYIR